MAAIAQLQANFDALATELRQVQQDQVGTAGTPRFWELQRQIGDLRQRSNEAERELLTVQIAGVSPTSPQAISWGNRLHFVMNELRSPAPEDRSGAAPGLPIAAGGRAARRARAGSGDQGGGR